MKLSTVTMAVIIAFFHEVCDSFKISSMMHRRVNAPQFRATPGESIDPIDPLGEFQNIPVGRFRPQQKKNPSQPPLKTNKTKQDDSNIPRKPKKLKLMESTTAPYDRTDKLTTDQKVLLSQAEILRTLPLDYFLSFRNICEQLVPRFGIYSLTFHVILLIPIIRIVKFQLNASVYPFLYIGPALFLVPYAFFWLWENDVCEVPIFDARLLQYVKKQKDSATRILLKDSGDLLKAANRGDDELAIKKLANLKLMSVIDIDNFMYEIIAVKKRIKGQSDRSSAMSTFTLDNSATSKQQVNFNDDVNSAVKTLIENSLLGEENESPQSLLQKLKQLEKDLENSA